LRRFGFVAAERLTRSLPRVTALETGPGLG